MPKAPPEKTLPSPGTVLDGSWRSPLVCELVREARLEHEPIRFSIVPAHVDDLRNSAVAIDTGNVHDHVNRERDCFASTSMREADIRRQDAMRKAREGLFGGVRVDCAQRALVAGVQCLQ